jgi:hypothetical protein
MLPNLNRTIEEEDYLDKLTDEMKQDGSELPVYYDWISQMKQDGSELPVYYDWISHLEI